MCTWAGLVVGCLLLWWEGLLSDKVRGHEVQEVGAICCLVAMAAWGWSQEHPILQQLADQLVLLHVDADQ